MSGNYVVVIPARFASVRLPGKPLVDIHGKPMIQWVYERVMESDAADVIVATDDERIAEAARAFGASTELTATSHQSGTDRIAEVAERRGWSDEDIVVNVQGDEPLLPPALIDQVAALAERDTEAAMATLVTPLISDVERTDPNVVKVVTDQSGNALYFSRAPIPWPRDGNELAGVRHIGMYAYRTWALKRLSETPPCALEQRERLEQLRALWLGLRIRVAEACEVPQPGIDTEEDLDAIRAEVARSQVGAGEQGR